MMRILGVTILLVGFAVMATGLAFAIQTFVGIYQDVAADPLGQSATVEEPEREAARGMLMWAGVGLAGALIAGIGAVLSMVDRRRRRRAQRMTG